MLEQRDWHRVSMLKIQTSMEMFNFYIPRAMLYHILYT